MSSSKYLSSETSEHLPRSAFEGVDIPRIYDELGLDYEKYILEDAGRAKTIQWVISKLSAQNTNYDEGCYVVDLGCASGRPTVETISQSLLSLETQRDSDAQASNSAIRKHVVMGVDLSPVQLSYARQRITAVNPIAQFSQGDMRSWSPPIPYCNSGVDAVLSFYALNHLHPEDFQSVVKKAVGWLKPGGVLGFGTIAHVNGMVKWLGYDIAGSSLPLDKIVELVESIGCKVETSWEEDWKSATREEAKGKRNQFVLAVKLWLLAQST